MNRTIMTALILAATVLAGASAFEWPVSELYPVSIFGQKKEQSVECGIVLEKTELVRAAGNGTVLLTIDSGYSPHGFPGTLGNAVIVAHDEGLVTIYGNLSSLDRIEQRTTVETGTILGEAGASGCTGERPAFPGNGPNPPSVSQSPPPPAGTNRYPPTSYQESVIDRRKWPGVSP